ncbi:MAG: DUF2478 domain-containing protein [Roseovarius sp.]|jgi:hypothetical protein|uniref:DUF2478 domain-containing protein n=1 Tax=Roseovarius sp. TaxID=1486281 RepID=UPI0032ED7E10
MRLARVTAEGRGAKDRLLATVVERLHAEGLRIAGAVRAVAPGAEAGHCDSALRLLPEGPVVDITQNLGTGSAACRMDSGALELAVAGATERLKTQGADLVVVNKFGISEAEGRGFRTLIAEALGRHLPVLIGVSDVHREAFDRFAGGMAVALPADEDAVLAWCLDAIPTSDRDMGGCSVSGPHHA